MSMFLFSCPFCKQKIEAQTEWIGKQAQCPYCGKTVVIQDEEAARKIPRPLNPDEKPCPFCGNTIKRDAIFCQFCKKDLPRTSRGDFSNSYQANWSSSPSLFQYALQSVTKKYCDFHGRACRKEFWGTILLLVLLGIPAGIFVGVGNAAPSRDMVLLGECLALLMMMATICPQACVVARRANDIGFNGVVMMALQFCIGGLNILNNIMTLASVTINEFSILTSLLSFFWGIFMIVIGCIKGQPGDNQFGPDPLR